MVREDEDDWCESFVHQMRYGEKANYLLYGFLMHLLSPSQRRLNKWGQRVSK